jgi:metal-dependent amidase/aminoacylase/carboxypeptidase family protein
LPRRPASRMPRAIRVSCTRAVVSLLGAAALLANDTRWSGTVHFIFQPAEEGYRGSCAMIDAGLFHRFPMARIFGFHNWPGLDAGAVAVHDDDVMASGGRVTLTIDGHPGHAGMPDLTRDPVQGISLSRFNRSSHATSIRPKPQCSHFAPSKGEPLRTRSPDAS